VSQEETLYIKIDQNILVHDYHVTLGDIAKLESSDKSMVRQLKQKKIYSFEKPKGNLKNKKQIQVISIMKVIAWIHEEYPNVDIQNMGEPDFVLEYEPKKERSGTAQRQFFLRSSSFSGRHLRSWRLTTMFLSMTRLRSFICR